MYQMHFSPSTALHNFDREKQAKWGFLEIMQHSRLMFFFYYLAWKVE